MRQKPGTRKRHGEKVVKDIRCATRKQYSAEENFQRVLRIISFTCLSADPFGPAFDLISYPFKDDDELKLLLSKNAALPQRL